MPWYLKTASILLDQLAIPGLYYLDGNIVSRKTQTAWTVGMKLPLIRFPSGVSSEVSGGRFDKSDVRVHFFGEMELLLFANRDAGFRQAFAIAEQVGYGVKKKGETELEIVGFEPKEHLLLQYDNALPMIIDVQHTPDGSVAQRPSLLDQASRAKLPPLYTGEKDGLGIEALAQVKFFSPDSGWTWYASEGSPVDENGYFDTDKPKVDYLFFGLVIGYEIEIGYFSLGELTSVRGPFGLSIERDLFFEPKTLRELQEQHRRERRGH